MLVLRALGLGDFLTAVPALRALARAHPGSQVTMAAPPGLAPLARLSGAVDRVLPAAGLGPVAWSGAGPEVAVNLHGRGPQSHARLLAVDPGRLVAFGCPQAGVAGPAWNPDEHEVSRWCRLVSTSFQVAADPADLSLQVPAEPAPVAGAVVVHPGAASPARRWPPDRFGAVAAWVAGRGLPVVVTGSADETALAERVRRAAGLPPEAVLAGRTDLGTLASIVAAARLVVCGDTGMAHLASAYRTPSALLFGPTPPSRWGPPVSGPHVAIWHGEEGDPSGSGPDPGLLRISVGEVLRQVEPMLAATRSEGGFGSSG